MDLLIMLFYAVPPSFSRTPDNATVGEGESVALQCRSEGEPVPTQRWLKDGAQLVEGKGHLI